MTEKTYNARFSLVIDKNLVAHLPRDNNFVQIHMDMPAQSHGLLGEMITTALSAVGRFRNPNDVALLITFKEEEERP